MFERIIYTMDKIVHKNVRQIILENVLCNSPDFRKQRSFLQLMAFRCVFVSAYNHAVVVE